MQMIRYHPLIDGDTDGLEKVPMFLSTDKETVRQNSRMYLSEIISNYYRLYSKEPMSQNATDSIEIRQQIVDLSDGHFRHQLLQV